MLDLAMPELTGFEVLNAIQRDELPTKVVVLSASDESESVFRAIAEGAVAYVPKESSRGRGLRRDRRRQPRRGRALRRRPGRARERDPQPRQGRAAHPDPARERGPEAHRRGALGSRDRLPPPHRAATVKTHMGSAYEKLGVSDRAAAVAEAMRQGLLE